jgi:beta-lactamase class A
VKKLGLIACFSMLLAGNIASAGAQTPGSASATELTPQAALTRLLSSPAISPEWLAPSFTDQIPATRLEIDIQQYEKALGPFVRVTGGGKNGVYLAIFEGGTLPALIALDERGRIIELLFRAPQTYSVDGALAQLRSLPGQVGFVVEENGKEIAGSGQDKQLSAGSPRLPVLNALAAEIARGRYRWSDTVKLQAASRSLPPGILQDWPAGSALTIESLASLMFSIGDNTATDSIIRLIGRDAVTPFAGENVPFLTTHDMFVLKSKQNTELLDKWREGTSSQRGMIAQLDRAPLPAAFDLDTTATNVDVDWHYSNRQLCDLMSKVQSLPLTSIDPGVAAPSEWDRIAYAGGSDWGATSMTTWLESKDGKSFCVSATWNETDRPIDQDTFENAYLVLINSVRTAKHLSS